MTLGNKIRTVRGKRTITSFAQDYGVHPNTLMNYEGDRKKPDAGFLTRLCGKEGIEPNWLLGFENTTEQKIPYERQVLEIVGVEFSKLGPYQLGCKLGRLLALAYERAVIANADASQIATIVRDLFGLLETPPHRQVENGKDRDADQRRSTPG